MPPSEPPTRTPSSTTLLVYPATLLLGSLFSILSPTARYPGPFADAATASTSPPINYFARKDNIFNLFFVKLGWIWFTLAFAALLLTYPPSPHRGRRQAQALSRYALATTAWYFVTQWFFGPAIIDRSFVVTGGKCEDALFELNNVQNEKGVIGAGVEDFGIYLTAAACKAAGGAWRGGHDVSGHVFMLVLVTAVLGFEALGGLAQESEVENDASASASANAKTEGEAVNEVRTWTLRFVGGIIGLGWWMLLMTAIWFHTWLEKANGLLISLSAIYIIYFLPRRVIPWRNVIGIPGV
ncbi:inositol phospholipid synthesis and fat-storage-inducing TM-domain-containing protein [Aspergillus recurvatus]